MIVAAFPSLVDTVVCYTAVFSVVMQRGGVLRDDTKNGCVADYRYHKSCIIPLGGGGVFILSTLEGGLYNREGGYFWKQIILEGKILIKRFELQDRVKENLEKDS